MFFCTKMFNFRRRTMTELTLNRITMNQKNILSFITSSRLFQEISFWMFFILLEINFIYNMPEKISLSAGLIITISRLFSAIASTYINLFVLIPKLLDRKKYILYVITLSGTITLVVLGVYQFNWYVFNDILMVFQTETHRPRFLGSLFGGTILLTVLSALIHQTKRWVQLKDVEIKLKEEQRQRLEAELKTLKSQINPHFLFNSLNNIYSLSLDKSDLTPEMILKLSSLMSYIIYETNSEFVPMSSELEFINNQMELETIRVKNRVNVQYHADESLKQYLIAPILFTPFIENTFKYVAKNINGEAFIKIKLTKTDSGVHFLAINSKDTGEITFEHDKHGIGIQNVEKRLDLIYKDKYELNITNDPELFTVDLKLDLS